MCKTGTQSDMCKTGTQADMCKTGTHSPGQMMQQLVSVFLAPHDDHLLTETPEIRIGEKVYPVDSRQKTVKKILALSDDESKPMGERIDEALKLALGDENAVEIDRMDMPFPAYQRLFELVMNAVTGQEDEPDKARFQTEKG